ncbi:Dimeric alpha-beta barrel [Artemisia annua]|uniref:Dimeric alpha-beta barrel n=1 Tax=Artemisia annua TaxID=35608 RepID=A0A2U1QC10_ARTAN|nr:Dimeric alpha-beta barrel [Artemisia annua]
MSGQDQIIEHVVLYKVKPDFDSTKSQLWSMDFNNLTSLNLTIHVSAGKLYRSWSSSLTFTHMLHTRYRAMDDLRKYRVHHEHVRLRTETVKPILDEVMAVDWISNCGSGYTIASIAGFPGPDDLEALDSNEELINLHKAKAKDLIESELVVDYVCPPAM